MAVPALDVFQVIADPSRREMMRMLSEKSLPIKSLAEHFDMSRPAVSKHIKVLYNAGFISIQDIGRERHCVLKQDGFKDLHKWLEYFDAFWANKLNKLGALINERNKSTKR